MNKNIKNKAFTLVELIVVITILAVLATVAFVSFQGYGQSSRDSVRLADLKSMEKVINLYRLTNSKYPTPDEATGITYSGSTAWTQGVFGTKAYTSNTSLSNVPTDPLTGLPYAYSVTNTKQEYQIAAVLEGEVSQLNTQSYAGDQIASVYVRGDYNGKFIKVHTGSLDYLLGVPSIIASDITSADIMDIVNNQRLVYKGYNNLPASYSGSIYDTTPTNGFNFTPNQVVLFEGDISELEDNISERTMFLDNLQTNYGGTEIAAESSISEVLVVDASSDSKASNYVANVLNNSLKTKIATVVVEDESLLPSCDGYDITIGSYVIAGCNVGAITPGIGTESYGGLYQWGNNYNFRDDQFIDNEIFTGLTSGSQVDTTIYGPGNYYNNNTFITHSNWGGISAGHFNLWGESTNTNLARQGPCEPGYHIPSTSEWQGLITEGGWGSDWSQFMTDLQIPLAGDRNSSNYLIRDTERYGKYWTTSTDGGGWAIRIAFNNVGAGGIQQFGKAGPSYGYSLRCFKN